MAKVVARQDRWGTAFGVGWFLAVRQLKGSSWGTTLLIISVMTLTFLNLVVVTGILVGLIEGAVAVNQGIYTGNIFISTLQSRTYIDNTSDIVTILKGLPEVAHYSVRYLGTGTAEANYNRVLAPDELPNTSAGIVAGIDPAAEEATTHLSSKLIEGEFLSPTDGDVVVLGANKLAKYLPIESPGLSTLKDVEVGSKIRLTIGDSTRIYTVKGIVKSKADEIDMRVFMRDDLLRTILGRSDYAANEIAVKLVPGADPLAVKAKLVAAGAARFAKVQTAEEGEPKFLQDIKNTFALLGNMIGSISLAVASITIFIVIFVNAITRRKYIGILKAIGIDGRAIEVSYILQSVFYASIGIAIGLVVLYGGLKPYLDAHPINFPFSDGILVAPWSGTLLRAAVLLVATIIAGYIPAKIVIRQNTLDAILGRK